MPNRPREPSDHGERRIAQRADDTALVTAGSTPSGRPTAGTGGARPYQMPSAAAARRRAVPTAQAQSRRRFELGGGPESGGGAAGVVVNASEGPLRPLMVSFSP